MDESVGIRAEFVMDDPRNYIPVEPEYPEECPSEIERPSYVEVQSD